LACGLDVLKLKPDEADRKTIDFLKKFIANLGLRDGLRAHGVKESLLDALASQAFADPCHATNPAPVNYEDLKALYQTAL
jgi:1,3-propanediol dehydrogenase